mmetsp:Transcript_125324/g.362580  ORF Transcript_125324/g.362580 Transcript_125324/m.362580 type:complete len:233 (-) Transcript_125324:522-1220(-)
MDPSDQHDELDDDDAGRQHEAEQGSEQAVPTTENIGVEQLDHVGVHVAVGVLLGGELLLRRGARGQVQRLLEHNRGEAGGGDLRIVPINERADDRGAPEDHREDKDGEEDEDRRLQVALLLVRVRRGLLAQSDQVTQQALHDDDEGDHGASLVQGHHGEHRDAAPQANDFEHCRSEGGARDAMRADLLAPCLTEARVRLRHAAALRIQGDLLLGDDGCPTLAIPAHQPVSPR